MQGIRDQWCAIFRAEDDMHQVEAQRLRHGRNYMSGLQPSPRVATVNLGLRPRLVCRRAFGPQNLGLASGLLRRRRVRRALGPQSTVSAEKA
jgi:hypothetical protein